MSQQKVLDFKNRKHAQFETFIGHDGQIHAVKRLKDNAIFHHDCSYNLQDKSSAAMVRMNLFCSDLIHVEISFETRAGTTISSDIVPINSIELCPNSCAFSDNVEPVSVK